MKLYPENERSNRRTNSIHSLGNIFFCQYFDPSLAGTDTTPAPGKSKESQDVNPSWLMSIIEVNLVMQFPQLHVFQELLALDRRLSQVIPTLVERDGSVYLAYIVIYHDHP